MHVTRRRKISHTLDEVAGERTNRVWPIVKDPLEAQDESIPLPHPTQLNPTFAPRQEPPRDTRPPIPPPIGTDQDIRNTVHLLAELVTTQRAIK
ncbi:hypothetical protein RDI58_028911 [Solanum bulbocastanum]|uniref:Uncharacterized protein n=1 Tax=Solanum bulbocastanum TaxID=147425 RepID=A0AAN8SQY4_SOLBU